MLITSVQKEKLSRRQRAVVRERGKKPRNAAQKEQWEIAARNEPRFRKAFRDLMSELFTPKMAGDVRRALDKSNATVASVLKVIPFFNERDKSTFPLWNAFAVRLQNAYVEAIADSSKAEAKRRGFKAKVEKADPPKPKLPVVPINPKSKAFVRRRSLTRAVEMSKDMKETIRAILADAFDTGVHPSEVVAEIKATVGLTKNMRAMVRARAQKLKEEGFTQAQVKQKRDKFADDLRQRRAETIARTETLDAQTQGLQDAWQTAKDEGLMPKGTKKRWVATNDERLSEICEELDGEEVPIDSQFPGGFDGPPAHPNCRSTMVLVFPE